MSNKEIVLKFYDEVFNGWDLTNVDKYMKADYMQHSPEVEDGRDGFLRFAEGFLAQKPHMDIFKVFEDGDYVLVFFKCTFEGRSDATKVMDIYRLEEGMLAEHWDIIQANIDDSKNASGRSNF